MTSTTATAPAAASRTGRARPGAAVLAAETRLFLREPFSLFWIAAFPTLLLVVIGLVPPFREAQDSLGGLRVIDAYVPVSVLLSVIMGTLQSMPQVITAYRQNKVLRRVSTTPARAWHLLAAQAALHGAAVLVSAALVIAIGWVTYEVAPPENLLAYALGLGVALAGALGLACLVSGVLRSPRTAAVVGSIVYLPSMFTAGVWMPVATMSGWLADVVALTPLGSSAFVLDAAAAGGWGDPVHWLVAIAWSVGFGLAATRYFRWE